ncbi:MAG: hypothetical protein JXA16_15020 [Bacteroidales bacterium]|nr:hypothetical protein [Bacteroidales bacterium]
MKEYLKFKRGSEWRKWDLHFHTKGTNKNDQFISNDFDSFCITLFKKAINHEISAFGITDYFSIDNYKKVISFVENVDTNINFIDNEKTIIKEILILPNVELRMLPVTDSGRLVNIHCIFNPTFLSSIENDFFSSIEYSAGSGVKYKMNRQGMIDLGKSLEEGLDDEGAFKKGVNTFVVSHFQLQTLLDNNSKFRDNVIIAVSNSSQDGASGMQKHYDFFEDENESSLEAVRKSIYNISDCIFSGNPEDIKYFLGKKKDDAKTVIKKCGSLKPCINGSDAHTKTELFSPYDNRYCWIKANTTFEGFKQILYEPEDRVKIQAFKPDIKNDRYIISELKFKDSSEKLFGNQTIQLNENLNSIIGGKSAGKSLLLYSAAHCIDPEQVDRTHKRLGFEGYKFKVDYDFEVIWKNGIFDINTSTEKNQKIIYIPQLYINYLVEKNNKEDLNQLVENILLQDSEFKAFFESVKEKIAENNVSLDSLLTSYLQTRQKALELQNKSKEIGKSTEISKAIEKIQKEISEGQKLSNLSPEEFKTYNDLLEEKSKVEKEKAEVNSRKTIMEGVLLEIRSNREQLLGGKVANSDIEIKGSIDRILDQLPELTTEIIDIRKKIGKDYERLIENLENEIVKLNFEEKIKVLSESLSKIDIQLKPFLIKLAGQKELQKLTDNLELEKKKYTQAVSLEKQFDVVLKDYHNLRNRTSLLMKERVEKYESIVKNVNDTRKEIGSGVTLECSLIYKQDDFPLFHQANKAAISKEHFFNQLFKDSNLKYNLIPDLYSKHLWIKENKFLKVSGDDKFELPLKQGYSLEEILRGLIKDSFIIDYSVTYKGDDLLRMSPGKKGTVLLILFLQISSSEYPILIDQPEDNLDNRTIYDLLCYMIKEKKKDRQIIIVSHNANLVVATDSENIIVANQEGQDGIKDNIKYQFEYVNGAIEHTFTKDKSIKEILYQQGIREHVCDILEGGDEAFKKREKKYSIK